MLLCMTAHGQKNDGSKRQQAPPPQVKQKVGFISFSPGFNRVAEGAF
jgi:hypothetical protein